MIGLPTPELIAEICDRAHDEMLVRGKAVGTMRDNAGRVCASQAIKEACDRLVVPELAHKGWVLTMLAIEDLYSGTVITDLNDRNSLDHTLDVFRNTAKAARNGGVFTPEPV